MSCVLSPEKEKISTPEKNGITVCFVCSGNTCRSPMAEAWLNHVGAKNGIRALSAGLCASGFSPISSGAVEALESAGVPCTSSNNYKAHISTPASHELFERCDRIIGMSARHTMLLIMNYPEYASKISSFPQDIPDPFGESADVYCEILEMIKKGILEEFGV
jgi:protein-tyrosine-phosphatase